MFRNLWRAFIRFAFHLFYNPLAFTYDPVSALVSRGQWRTWTRAAIPHIVGTRVLEIPCGSGNLFLDMLDAGYRPVGVDLSSAMLGITRRKLKSMANMSLRGALSATKQSILLPGDCFASLAMMLSLARARAESMPFASASFDSIVMTFPPGFVFDPRVLAEFHRILDVSGRLIWVDAARLLPRDAWSRVLNAALDATSGNGNFAEAAKQLLGRAQFEVRVETVRDEASVVRVVIASKRRDE